MKISKSLIFIFLFMSTITILISYQLLKQKINLLKQEKYLSVSKEIQTQTKMLIDEKTNATLAIAISLSYGNTIQDALKNNQIELVKLDELSLALKKNSDFKNVWFQVIRSDGKSFYRSWIDKRGDSVLKARKDIALILKNPRIISTISVGKFDMTFQSIVPIYQEDKLFGIIEVITHFNSIAKKLVKKGIEPIIMVDKKYKSQLKYPFTKLFIDDYYVANLNAKPQYMDFIKQKKIKHFLNHAKNYHKSEESGNLITLYELHDIYGKTMSHIILFKPLKDIDMSDIGLMKEKMIFYILALIILLASIFYYLANKKFISEISSKNLEMQKLNRDLSESIKQQKKIQEQKDQQQEVLFQQSKMAAMGEMIGNIAHQWRQPIAIISMWANNIIADIDMEEIEDKNLRKYATKINEQTNHLSQTIDDFRNFFAPNKKQNLFILKNSIDKTMDLLSASFKTHNIEVIKDIQNIKIVALENELTQAILNIIKNAKDILITLDKDTKKLIFIKVYKQDNSAIIEILDNGGGVPTEIIDKIFDPYFTTKHKSQGTGIGLYMTESIITKHLHGKISVRNIEYNYEDVKYKGAKFTIQLSMIQKGNIHDA